MKKKLLAALLAAAMLTGLASATFAAGEGEEDSGEIPAVSIMISKGDYDHELVNPGTEIQLEPDITLEDGSKYTGSVTWWIEADEGGDSIPNTSVEGVSVNKNGKVTIADTVADGTRFHVWMSIKPGMAEVIFQVSAGFDPDAPDIKSIRLMPVESHAVKPGSVIQLEAEIILADDSRYDGELTWAINPAVEGISIDGNGKVTVASTVADGTEFNAEMSFPWGGAGMAFKVLSVFDPNAPDFKRIGIAPVESQTVKPGSVIRLESDIILADDSKYEGDMTWEIEPDVEGDSLEGISIDGSGKVTIANTVADGTRFWVNLSVLTKDGVGTATMLFTVASVFDPNAPDFRRIAIVEPASHDIARGSSVQLTHDVTLEDGSRYQGDVIWEIDPATEGISVDANGRVTVAGTVPVGTKFWVQLSVIGRDGVHTAGVLFFVVEPSGNSSSGGSSSGGSGEAVAPAPVEETVNTAQAVQKTEQAIAAAEKADPNASQVVVKMRNVKSITAAALKAVVKAAEQAEKAPVIHADVVKDGKVESRLYIDPAMAKGNEEIKLGVTLGDEKVSAKFDQYFQNEIAVVKFDQAGSFGMPVKAAVKLDLSKLDTKTLVFYSYDPKTNSYTRIAAPNYRIDANGYLHFTTSVGNCVIVTDEPLARK